MEVIFVSERITVLGRHQASLAIVPWGKSNAADSLTVILNGSFEFDQTTIPGYIELESSRPDNDPSEEEFIGEARLDVDESTPWAHLSMPRSNLMSLASVSAMSKDAVKMKLWVTDTPLSMKSVMAVEWALEAGDKP